MIQLVDIHKSFGENKVLDGLNLTIETGSNTVLLGRSGSGKSVTIKHIIGLVQPDSGKVLIDGEELTGSSAVRLNRLRTKFGMLFQDAALFDSMSVWENVAFPLLEHRRGMKMAEVDAEVRRRLALVGLAGVEDRFPSELSGGMKKRVGLARAIVLEPEILLFDEPTSGLDPIMADAINQLIVKMGKELGVTNFIISHDVQSALRIADKIAVLFRGKIIEEGSPNQISASQNPVVMQFLQATSLGPVAAEEV